MTRRDVDSLLRDWDDVSRTARTPEPAIRRGRVSGTGLASPPLVLVAAVVVAGVALFVRPLVGPTGGGLPDASMSAVAPGTDVADDGTLRLTLRADQGSYAEGDTITASATLEYLGPDAQVDIFTALDAVVFSVAELGGDRQAGGGARQSCNRHTLLRGEPVTYPWTKFAAYVPGDPAQAFAEWYATSGSTLRLPAGTWRLSAAFDGDEGGCGGVAHPLTAEVVVVVRPATAASVPPAAEGLTPVPGAPSADPSGVVSCGQLASVVCGSVLSMLAADHRDLLAAATRIVVDDTCPPDSLCDRQLAFDTLVVVVPPAGLGVAVTFSARGQDGPKTIAEYRDVIPAHIAGQVDRPAAAPAPIPLETAAEPPPAAPATPRACMDALIDGTLAVDGRGSLGIGPIDAAVETVGRVRWPWGYAARVDAVGIALVDAEGAIVAHAGARLQLGGGLGEDHVWDACNGISGVASAP